MEKKKEVKGKKSTEKIEHFQCGKCRKWWSIGDSAKRDSWYCPWCGEKQKFTKE